MNNTTSILSNLTNITDIHPPISASTQILDVLLNPFWIIQSVVILVVAYLIVWALDLGLRFLSEQLGTQRHILAMVIPVLKIIVYILTIFFIISPLITIGIAEFAVLSGLIGAGIGLGLKDLFADVVAGFVIIIEKPYQIGDKIQIGNQYGEVIDIGLVQTVIVTPGDSRVSIPNYTVLSNPVSSSNAGSAEMMVITDLYLSYDSDISKASQILTETVITSRYVYVSDTRPYIILVENLPLYRKITAKAYVNDLRNEFIFKSDITKRAWEAFKEAGIKPPDISMAEKIIPDSVIKT